MKRTGYFLIFLSCFCSTLFGQEVQIDTLTPITEIDAKTQLDKDDSSFFQSSSKVKTGDIPVQGNLQLLSLLQHRNASLSIFNNSGSPGASMTTILRGKNSYLNNSSPLIILDGMPIDNSEWNNNLTGTDQSNRLIDINPNDIASVRVINGSVGSVLYGIRGANGVLILTSKVGLKGAPRTHISSEVSFSRVGKLPARQSEYAQGYSTAGSATYYGPETRNAFSWGPKISTLEYDGSPNYPYDKNGQIVPQGAGNGTPANSYDPYVFFQNAVSSNLNASVRGGTSLFKYYISGGRNTTSGVIPKTNYIRNTISGSLSTDVNEKITIQASARYINGVANRNQKGSNLQGVMLGLLRNTPSFDITNGLSPSEAVNNSSAYTLENGMQRSYRAGIYDNPYWSINNNPHKNVINRSIASASIDYKFNKDIVFNANGGIDTYLDSREGGKEINPGWSTGSAYLRERKYRSTNFDLNTKINKSINEKFETKFQIGVNYFDRKIQDEVNTGLRLNSPGNISISSVQETIFTSNTISNSNFGVYSAIDLNYNKVLNVNLSARQDYSSTSGSNQQGFLSYGIYSSVDLLNIFKSNEEGESQTKLKVFAGYGRSGLLAPASSTLSSFIPTVILGDGYLQSGDLINTLERSDIGGNPDLKAEKTDAFEIGFSTSLLSNRISLRATYYNEKSSDVIMLRDIAPSSGFSTIYDNVASIRNKGIEVSLTVNPIKTDIFSWTLNAHFNNNKNTIEEINMINNGASILSGFNSIYSAFIEGEAYGSLYSHGFLTNDEGQTVIGDDGFPLLAQNRSVRGDPNPDYILGFDNQFSIGKSLKISVLIDVKQGGDVYCGTCQRMDYHGVSQLSADERGQSVIFDGVTLDGSTNTTLVELVDESQPFFEYYRVRYGSVLNVFDASWVRIRRLDLTYDLSSIMAKTSFLHSLSVGLYADNLWLSTDYPGIDPETNLAGNSNGSGFDYFNNPSTRTIGASINITF